MDFQKIAKKWQRQWKTRKIYESDPDNRPKYLITTPYPYVNGLMHLGHTYTYMRVDAYARYKRMQGYNVLFPFAYHATGSPIDSAARRIREGDQKQIQMLKDMEIKEEDIPKFQDSKHWIKTFSKQAEKDLQEYGLAVDWRRTFITTDLNPRYDKFIKWQFNTLKKKGLVQKGEHPVVWSPKENMPVGDHDRAEGEGETPQEMTLIKFRTDGHILPCATFRPETIYGATNIWVNPEITYIEANVDGEHWIITEESIIKLKDQKHNIQEIKKIKGTDIIGATATNPITGTKIPVLPAKFVTPDTGTGIVMSVPSHAPYDYIALKETGKNLPLISVITVEEYGEHPAKEICEKMNIKDTKDTRLEEATQEIYKKEHHTGKLKQNTGKYAGQTIQQVKKEITKDFVTQGKATILYELMNPVISRSQAKCHVKIVDNQWFLKYSDTEWKQKTMKCLGEMKLYPEKVRAQFEYVIDWLNDWACTREYGMGTNLPWDKKWKIESLSDSTIYNAYYTIAHKIKKITLGKINDKFFDYVFLGEGNTDEIKIEKQKLDELRNEFNYWYPVDFRNSGKDLIQNHFTFYIFNHTAIFPEKQWPKGIAANGHIKVNKEKMSKSKGNFKTLRQVIKQHGQDPTRISVLSTGEELNDVDWNDENTTTLRNKLEQWYDFAIKHYGNGSSDRKEIDNWMEHQLNKIIKETTQAMEQTHYRTAIQKGFLDLQRHLKWYVRRTAGKMNSQILKQIIEAQTLMLTPFTPHMCEEIWNKLERQQLIVNENWPKYDENKINFAIEQTETLMTTVMDDVAQVLKLAKIDRPNTITLFVAKDWKTQLCRKLKELTTHTRNIGEIMKSVIGDFKENAQEASALVQKLVKDPSKIPENTSHQEAEYQNLVDSREFLKQEYNCQIEIIKEQDSTEQKAKQAMPGKPAILVK